ncbi:hypothetical protein CVD25_14830 [Bacillus canaveralius]|uniref:Membrane-spanning protein n=1 Tax=Bacillus canaveralius TaxID=1403243 RepID=A0A2N5GHJ9_9BACI|nr:MULTISPECIES: hypothetical protein [Bacillus]PLR80294.1 hypothetical protein CU635_18400 [Bacillus canaveralius]PLR85774.1 hypothetical protein CVD23_07475 [Bacillus sp. V33-4]PLR95487.1 hypothetical protein CVD25_14830 [Bacillus canaveralius]RSK53924.1 hypothetical protein EJA13_06750 [Bacillus canaveralius]
MNRKIVMLLSLLYVLFMASLSVYYYSTGESYKSIVAIGGIICGAIPLLLSLFTKLHFNLPIIISYLLFLVGSQYLGSILGWYELGWWDTFLHFISGVILAFTGIALYERLVHRSAGKHISPWFIFLFTLSFSVFGGVVWEIYEFSGDQLFGMTLQGGGNKDTMMDLVSDTAGGLLIAALAGIRTKVKINKGK